MIKFEEKNQQYDMLKEKEKIKKNYSTRFPLLSKNSHNFFSLSTMMSPIYFNLKPLSESPITPLLPLLGVFKQSVLKSKMDPTSTHWIINIRYD